MKAKDARGGTRNSSIELFRIISMLCIVAHHYVVNSGIIDMITQENALTSHSLFSLLFGWGGKTGINCFILITGYFMCQSQANVRKFLKLLLEVEFYRLATYLIFLASGYEQFSLKELVKSMVPVYSLGTGFTHSYLVFYLFIPYLNLLVRAMDQMQHLTLVGLCLLVGTVFQTFLKAPAAFTYVGWFMALYFLAAYIRLYPRKCFSNRRLWGSMLLISLLLSWGSVLAGAWAYERWGKAIYYYFVSDSNKLLAVVTAVSAFLFFKNLEFRYHPVINRIAASAFGVLMIHANSDTMRQWLWGNLLNNVAAYHNRYFMLHAIGSVIGIYAVCTLIDMVRIRFLETPFLRWYDRTMG
jgi:hypothetical protein|nr:acyltransferase [uncultured Acetatifactor sp.]